MHLQPFIVWVVLQRVFLICHSRHCDIDQPHSRGVWYELFSQDIHYIYSSADMDMEWFQSVICDNSFCAAYSKETRGAKPISETIPPEIDNTADSILPAQSWWSQWWLRADKETPFPQRIVSFAHFVSLPFLWASISMSKCQWLLAGGSWLATKTFGWPPKAAVTICWQLLFQLKYMRSRILDRVLDEETVFGFNS